MVLLHEVNAWTLSGVTLSKDTQKGTVTLTPQEDGRLDNTQPLGVAIGPIDVEPGCLYTLSMVGQTWNDVGSVNAQVQIIVASTDEHWQEMVPLVLDDKTDWLRHSFIVPTTVHQVYVHCCFAPWCLFKARTCGLVLRMAHCAIMVKQLYAVTSTSRLCDHTTVDNLLTSHVSHPSHDPMQQAPLSQHVDHVYILNDSRSSVQANGVRDLFERVFGVPGRVLSLITVPDSTLMKPITSAISTAPIISMVHSNATCQRCFQPDTPSCSSMSVSVMRSALLDAHSCGYANILFWSDLDWPRYELADSLVGCLAELQGRTFGAVVLTDGSQPSTHSKLVFAQDHSLSGTLLSSSQIGFDRMQEMFLTVETNGGTMTKSRLCRELPSVHVCPSNPITSVQTSSTLPAGGPPVPTTLNTVSWSHSEADVHQPSDIILLTWVSSESALAKLEASIAAATRQSLQNWRMIVGCPVAADWVATGLLDQLLTRIGDRRVHCVRVSLATRSVSADVQKEAPDEVRQFLQQCQAYFGSTLFLCWWDISQQFHHDRLAVHVARMHAVAVVAAVATQQSVIQIGCVARYQRTTTCCVAQPSFSTFVMTVRTMRQLLYQRSTQTSNWFGLLACVSSDVAIVERLNLILAYQ